MVKTGKITSEERPVKQNIIGEETILGGQDTAGRLGWGGTEFSIVHQLGVEDYHWCCIFPLGCFAFKTSIDYLASRTSTR